MPAMLAAVIAPRTNGFTPNIRPNNAPTKKTSPGTIRSRAFIANSTPIREGNAAGARQFPINCIA
jgi:hypothetical protein